MTLWHPFAVIYDGTNAFEAVGEGCVKRSIPQSLQADAPKYADVYRFISADGHHIDDAGFEFAPIQGTIDRYAAQGNRYAYESLLFLALLTTTRRIQVPVVGWVLRLILDNALDVLDRILALGKEPMICSELVYRCYTESGKSFAIDIPGAHPLLAAPRMNAHNLVGVTAAESAELERRMDTFLRKYAKAKLRNRPRSGRGVALNTTTVDDLVVADFVTPADLKASHSLIKIGRLSF
jgi:hypothetical protein